MKTKNAKLLTVALSTILILGCSLSSGAEANLPDEFEEISEDKISGGYIHQLRHVKTGCYYVSTYTGNSSGGLEIQQMFVEKNGVSVPYCDEKK